MAMLETEEDVSMKSESLSEISIKSLVESFRQLREGTAPMFLEDGDTEKNWEYLDEKLKRLSKNLAAR